MGRLNFVRGMLLAILLNGDFYYESIVNFFLHTFVGFIRVNCNDAANKLIWYGSSDTVIWHRYIWCYRQHRLRR